MPKLHISMTPVYDATGYLFSLSKCLAAVLYASPWADRAADSIATSGFAFRIWINRESLCPSAASIWSFAAQKPWVENGGFACEYVERLWGQDAIEEQQRLAALAMIRKSIDNGIGVIGWDISGCEWGVIAGYDDEAGSLYTVKINGEEGEIPYEKLGNLEIPILSVLSVTGTADKTDEQIYEGTKAIAAAHLRGEEWCDNARGLEAFDALIHCVKTLPEDAAWNAEYALGTYGALRWYAKEYFRKCSAAGYGDEELAVLYLRSFTEWNLAFRALREGSFADTATREKIAAHLQNAKQAETAALARLES
ncbi:MAG: hypothetical protein IJX14_06620 [Clostridia bacterium]|nr:hypothetical protein [Clostridia bacterium]